MLRTNIVSVLFALAIWTSFQNTVLRASEVDSNILSDALDYILSPLTKGCIPVESSAPPFYFIDQVDPYQDIRRVSHSQNNDKSYSDRFYAEGSFDLIRDFRSRTVTRRFSAKSFSKTGNEELRVMRNSLVTTDLSVQELAKLRTGKGAAAVTLFSTAPATEIYTGFLNDLGKSIQAKKGQSGYILASLLTPGDDSFIYVLAQDAPALGLVKGDAISPRVYTSSAGKKTYQKALCFNPLGESTHYRFDVVRNKKRMTSDFSINLIKKNSLQLTPVRSDLFERINDLEFSIGKYGIPTNPWGMVQLPMNKNFFGPNQWYVHYRNQRVLDGLQEDTWGRPESVCQFMRVARDFRKECLANCTDTPSVCDLRCITQVGDLAWVTPGKSDAQFGNRNSMGYDGAKDALSHMSHNSGSCFDLRPFSQGGDYKNLSDEDLATYKEKLSLASGLSYSSGDYSRFMTRAFVRGAVKYGGFPIFFNDPSLFQTKEDIEKFKKASFKDAVGNGSLRPRVGRAGGHDNHVHVCFDMEYSESIKTACKTLKSESPRLN